jgi:opacity protein-like surface antigen
MTTRNRTLALAVAAAFVLPATASARGVDFNYIDLNYVNVDVDISETVVEDGETFSIRTGSDHGFQVGGAFEIWETVHLFGEYSQASQDLTFAEGTFFATGDFDVVRWRVGIGYAVPFDEMLSAYGRVSFDRTEFKDIRVGGENFGSDKDDGFGAEVGMLWSVTPEFQLQPFVRYTSVGEIDEFEENKFNSDFLFGVGARWFVTDQLGLQAGYEYGEIKTFNLGLRFAF